MSRYLGPRVPVSIRVPISLHRRLAALADRAGQPLNTFIIRALASRLNPPEKLPECYANRAGAPE